MLTLSVQFQAATSAIVAGEVRQILRQHAVLSGLFTQINQLPGRDDRAISTGRFLFVRDQGLRWDVLEPVQATWLAGPAIARKTSNMSGWVSRLIASLVDGSILKDQRFTTELSGDKESWRLKLTPRSDSIRKQLSEISLSGDMFLHRITLNFSNQQIIEINFDSVESLQQLDSSTCARLQISC